MSLTTRLAAVAAPPIDSRLEALTLQLHDLRATIDAILETLTRQEAAADALDAPAAVVAQMPTEMLTPMPAPVTRASEIEAAEAETSEYEVAQDETAEYEAPEYEAAEMSEAADAVVEAVAEDHAAEDLVAESDIAPAADAETEDDEPTPAIRPESTASDADEEPATLVAAAEMQPAPAAQAEIDAEIEPVATEVADDAGTAQEETDVDLAAPSEASESTAEPSASTPEASTADLDTTEPMADLPATVPDMTAPAPVSDATVISLSDHRRDQNPPAESIVRVVRPRRRAAKIAACILAAMAAGSLWFADLSALGGVPSSLGRALSTPPPAAADWSLGELWQRIQAGARAAEAGRHSGAMSTEGFAGSDR